jgi:uncharacterized membrane protein
MAAVEQGPRVERERDLDRFLTLVDAIVAIAITLLVLPLVNVVTELQDGGSVAHLLHTHLPELGAFLLSFLVIARLWLTQHRAVRHLVALNLAVYWVLMLWALTIVFLPFPTALVAEQGHQTATKVLDLGTSALSLASLTLLNRVIARHPELTDDGKPTGEDLAWRNAGLMLVALALTATFPVLSYWPMLLQTLDTPLGRLTARLRGRRTA